MPTKIVFGINKFDDLPSYINNERVIVVTSNGFIKRGLKDRLESLIGDNVVKIFTDVKSHPEFKDLEKIYNEIHKNEFDMILAIGGGSIIDASKFFSIYNYTKEAKFVTNLIKNNNKADEYSHIPLICIPTTAGTGSEITPWATIWDMNEKKKYSLHLPELFSKVAIYDPLLTISVPRDITIQTGLDALSHSFESIWNKNSNEITINYAIKASKLIMKYLPKLIDDLENIEYRTEILKACMYAGLAFSNTQTALAHAMSYYITTHKGIPHGIACSFTLPYLVDKVIGKYKFIDNALKEIFEELSSETLRKMFQKLGISVKFEDYGIDEVEMQGLLDNIKNNPRASNSLI